MEAGNLPPKEMGQEHAGGLLQRLYDHPRLWCHWRVGQLEGIEVEDRVEDAVGRIRPRPDQDREAVQRSINK